MPFAQATWEHKFKTDRAIDAAFAALPGSDFTVYGADAPRNAARVDAGFWVAVAPDVMLSAAYDGALSARSDSYGGNGGIKMFW